MSVIIVKLLRHNYLVLNMCNCATKLWTETGLSIATTPKHNLTFFSNNIYIYRTVVYVYFYEMIFKTKLLYDSHISKLDNLKIIHPLFSQLKYCPNDFFYQTRGSICIFEITDK
jgi:hypothetical protein